MSENIPSSEFAGDPDGFGRLWMPQRMAYLLGHEGKPKSGDCVFCEIPTRPDEDALIVARGTLVFAVLNLFPYNQGHLMVVPYRHLADYAELTADELAELTAFTSTAITVLREVYQPHGFNLGMNLGAASGAGIEAHLHQHIVPRWSGDTNFLPIIAQARVLPELLADTRARLAEAWPKA